MLEPGAFHFVVCLLEQEACLGYLGYPGHAVSDLSPRLSPAYCVLGEDRVEAAVPWLEGAARQALPLVAKIHRVLQQL